MKIENNSDLLGYLLSQAGSGNKNWFGFPQQRMAGIHMVYEIAKYHANTMPPEVIVDYVIKLNNAIYHKIIKADNGTRDRKSTRLNSSHSGESRMPSSA